MYYAKARFYDADNRHFAEMDPILDPSQYDLRKYVKEPMALVQQKTRGRQTVTKLTTHAENML